MRTRIVGLAVWVSVLAIGLFGVPLAVAVHQYALQAERDELLLLADTIATAVSPYVPDHVPRREIPGPGSVEVGVYDVDGRWLGGARSSGPSPELARALAGAVATGSDKGELVAAVPVLHEDDVLGAVRVATSLNAVMTRVALVWSGMATLAAVAVAVAWLVGRRQARRLARPLEELAIAARSLGDGDFSVRTRRGGIHEIDAVGAALDDTAVRLDDLLAREQAFSTDTSHQLRTPLAGLRLRLEAALEQPNQDPWPAIAASLTDADRLETTINELLALARDSRRTESGPVDLSALLEELAPEWRDRLALQNRDLRVSFEGSTEEPVGSTAAIRQVLAVLIDNAMTHGAGTVDVTVREAPDAVAIDVSDEGPGIREPTDVLFARGAERHSGNGIGLPLARRLAQAEGGRLLLARRTPPTFTLLLPAAINLDDHDRARAAGADQQPGPGAVAVTLHKH
ncbi:HAMP domain-containing sensor histidine kinase [Pseudonocardia yunnanensis]|uniref:Signal transduction histidine-protein kinase/phosphatase MprB n=1 Tax=Pseudonocardia yunnanensis TaxID=58107 RepID=A0ABW4F6G2_9PSEU